MKAESKFLNQPLEFWANIKLISQKAGYTDKKTKQVKVYTIEQIKAVYESNNLDYSRVIDEKNKYTPFGNLIVSYFQHRSDIIRKKVEPNLMKLSEAKKTFLALKKKLKPACPLPLNKQKGKKKGPAYLTGIVNMIIEKNSRGFSCDYNPKELTAFTKDKFPARTLSRRVDGAFPTVINPIAIWEIKEYYYTTTFGSRVADGVYETWLDGLELREVKDNLKIHVEHFLIIDDHFTWWTKGRSYLCRIIDMLHMGILTEALFGKEVIERLPQIVKEWTAQENKKEAKPKRKRKASV